MRGLKLWKLKKQGQVNSRIFYRCVDWNITIFIFRKMFGSRIFYRCVDWNPEVNNQKSFPKVASFTDAWIETLFDQAVQQLYRSHLLQMRGLKPKASGKTSLRAQSRIFYRCVDWNVNNSGINGSNCSRIFYRCVDWNTIERYAFTVLIVASFTDAWIETYQGRWYPNTVFKSHLLQMRGLKP